MSKESTVRPKKPLWCQRCHTLILNGKWHTSWFKDEEICPTCHEKEEDIKKKLTKAGKNPADFEGCGYLPGV